MQSVCFDPQDKSNSVGFENITELRFVYKDDIKFARAGLEPMGVMKNLKRLEITYYNICSKPTFQPWFKGFRFSSDLKEVHLNTSTNMSLSPFSVWGDLISQYLPQITRLELGNLDRNNNTSIDLSWIPKLKNLKILVLSNLNLYQSGPFYKTPMANLKRLELDGYSSENSTFLINLSEIFPALDTLIITKGKWKISALEDVLKSLGNFENLRTTKIKCCLHSSDDKQLAKSIMEQALEIIEKKFPVDSTEIEIHADVFQCHNLGYGRSYVRCHYEMTIIKKKGKEPSLKITDP